MEIYISSKFLVCTLGIEVWYLSFYKMTDATFQYNGDGSMFVFNQFHLQNKSLLSEMNSVFKYQDVQMYDLKLNKYE